MKNLLSASRANGETMFVLRDTGARCCELDDRCIGRMTDVGRSVIAELSQEIGRDLRSTIGERLLVVFRVPAGDVHFLEMDGRWECVTFEPEVLRLRREDQERLSFRADKALRQAKKSGLTEEFVARLEEIVSPG